MSRLELESTGARQVLGTTGVGLASKSVGTNLKLGHAGGWFHGSLGLRVASLAGAWRLSGQLGTGPSWSLS